MPGGSQAFYPQGPSLLIALTTVGSAGVSPSTAAGIQGVKIDNLASTCSVFVAAFPTSTGVALLPTTAASQPGFFVRASQSQIVSVPPNSYFSALTTAAAVTAIACITPGYGI